VRIGKKGFGGGAGQWDRPGKKQENKKKPGGMKGSHEKGSWGAEDGKRGNRRRKTVKERNRVQKKKGAKKVQKRAGPAAGSG